MATGTFAEFEARWEAAGGDPNSPQAKRNAAAAKVVDNIAAVTAYYDQHRSLMAELANWAPKQGDSISFTVDESGKPGDAIEAHRQDKISDQRAEFQRKAPALLKTAWSSFKNAEGLAGVAIKDANLEIRAATDPANVQVIKADLQLDLDEPTNAPAGDTRVQRLLDYIERAEIAEDADGLKAARVLAQAELQAAYDSIVAKGGTEAMVAGDLKQKVKELRAAEQAPITEAQAFIDQIAGLGSTIEALVLEGERIAGVEQANPAWSTYGAWEVEVLGKKRNGNDALGGGVYIDNVRQEG